MVSPVTVKRQRTPGSCKTKIKERLVAPPERDPVELGTLGEQFPTARHEEQKGSSRSSSSTSAQSPTASRPLKSSKKRVVNKRKSANVLELLDPNHELTPLERASVKAPSRRVYEEAIAKLLRFVAGLGLTLAGDKNQTALGYSTFTTCSAWASL